MIKENPSINLSETSRVFLFDRPPVPRDCKNFKVSDIWIQYDRELSSYCGYFIMIDRYSRNGVWIDLLLDDQIFI